MRTRYKKSLMGFISKNKFISVSLVVFILSLLSIVVMLVQVFFQNQRIVAFSKDGPLIGGNENLSVSMEIPLKNENEKNCWRERDGSWGSQYDIYVSNNSDYAFLDWTLLMTVPKEGRIDSSWNADYKLSAGKIIIKGIDKASNKIIPPHNSIKLGFVFYSRKLMESSSFSLIGRFVRNPLKEVPFIVCLFCFGVSLIVILVSLFFYRKLKRQVAIDNEKIESLLKLCANFIDKRDEYTKKHSTHVGIYSKKIAAEMGFDEEYQKNIYYMGMMHDVGKVLIPKAILCKPGKLTEEEWSEMKKHTVYGGEILESFNVVKGIRESALHHHERYDGSGYPAALQGESIPLQARIIAVADAYDAMHTDRPYRQHLTDDVIYAELEKNKGVQFDPEVADAMLRLLINKKVYENFSED